VGYSLAILTVLLAQSCPAATYHVSQNAPGASDQNAGTEAAPLKSIGAAVKLVKPGDTVLVGDGVYREEVVCPLEDWKDPQVRCTLAAMPNAHPVIEGADPVPGPWERAEVKLSTPPATPPAIYACAWETYSMMVFVDGQPLKQVGLQGSPARAKGTNGFQWQKQWDGKSVEDLRPGSFYYDEAAKRLCVWLADGSDPKPHTVEASVRDEGILLRGTWTLRGLTVQHVQDGFWPREQAAAVTGDRAIIEDCRILHNDPLGLIVSGQDCIIRNNEIGYNGLEGMTSNVGYRMLVEGNDFHHNAWRGDVVCLTAGNKFVMWRDSKFVRNRWHDEPAAALWMDISNANILIAENTFDDCAVGVYWEISRWTVIANNVFRGCGRPVWTYGSDALIAHNVFDRCGDGVVVTGYPRTGTWAQAINEDVRNAPLMGTHNNLIVDNLMIDCVGSFVGITQGQPHGWGNWSDYNAFVWTVPAYHPTGCHLNFMDGWDDLYGKLPIWRMERHCDTHSVVVDPGQLKTIREGNPYVGLSEKEVFADAKLVDRDGGDYRLSPDSPLQGKGLTLPMELNSVCAPCTGNQVLTRAYERTRLADAPDPATAVPVYGTKEDGHYRLQPLPKVRPLVDLDACAPGTPGLNAEWRETGRYPQFKPTGDPDTAAPNDWVLLPTNLLTDPSFDKPLSKPGEEPTWPWTGGGGMHTYVGMACLNLLPAQRQNALAWQKVGPIRPNCEYLLTGDMTVASVMKDFSVIGQMYLSAGDQGHPIGEPITVTKTSLTGGTWATYSLHLPQGAADAFAGQDLYVVLAGRVAGPGQPANPNDPAAFIRWDDLWLLASP
jgi:parallel beta-helix repeat protein